MRNLLQRRTPEQSVKEAEEEQEEHGYDNGPLLDIAHLDCNERGGGEHDCCNGKSRFSISVPRLTIMVDIDARPKAFVSAAEDLNVAVTITQVIITGRKD
jgi:hypothetical protein